jgi:hypothetical protein
VEVVKSTKEYTIYKKRSGRYGVKNAKKKWVNADEKVKVLLAEGLIKAPTPKAEPAPEAEVQAEETAEAPAEEAPAEE